MNRIWNFSAFGSRPALTDDTGVTVRYNELAELQDQLAGIGPGELTMMLCENSIGALAGYAAIAQGIAWWVIPLAAVGNGAGSYLMKGLLTGKLITRNL